MACGADQGGDGNGSGDGSGNGNGSGSGSDTPQFEDKLEPGKGGGSTNGGSEDGGGCSRFDIVFSIDNSMSMREEQEAMGREIFPKFADKLLSLNDDIDGFRAGVIDACPTPATFHDRGRERNCSFASGKKWIESSSQAFKEEFSCVGAINSDATMCSGSNDDEQPASTALAAVKANAGFLRDDAILVIVAMTDEDEQPDPRRSTDELYNELTKLKKRPQDVVFLGIGGGDNCSGPYGDADEAEMLKSLTGKFSANGRGVFWDLCDGSLETGLEKAIQTIDQACKEFIPIL
jgi:hypothetical protein